MDKRSKIHLQDEDFIRKNSLQCRLFLQIDEYLCKILICDKEGNLHDVEEFESKEFLNNKWPFINLRFAQSTIVTPPETFIFIPEEFESADQQTIISPFLDSDSDILSAKIKNTAINTYFTVNKNVSDFQNLLSESEIIPSANLLIQQILSAASENTEVIGINLYKEDFELVYVKNKQFIFYNRFPKANADDFNYYLLSTFEQFGIQAASAQFYLAGDIDRLDETVMSSQGLQSEVNNPLTKAPSPLKTRYSDENYRRLSKYSSHIHFLADLDKGKESTILANNSSNQFFLLSGLSKCV